MDDFEQDDDEDGGAGWLMTFADLMSLLMSFFVLLLSFSEMDIQKYKQVAGSMKNAFGIQREVKTDVIPKGTSLVTSEFSPGRPDPDVLIKEMRQNTTDEYKDNLDFDNREFSKKAENLAALLKRVLEQEVADGMLDIILDGNNVSVRVREKDSFSSGSALLDPSFNPVLEKVSLLLNNSKGQIIVSGHTDSVPISTAEYSSNWVLSSARSASVVHFLGNGRLDDISRVQLRAFADTQPLVPNTSVENRAKNRRIEITINFDETREILEKQVSSVASEEYF